MNKHFLGLFSRTTALDNRNSRKQAYVAYLDRLRTGFSQNQLGIEPWTNLRLELSITVYIKTKIEKISLKDAKPWGNLN
jgi:hypothetical protein